MFRMQEMAFPCFKFQKIFWEYATDPLFMCGMSDTHVAFSRSYLPLIYYLTERSLFKKCPPPKGKLKSSKKALFQIDGKTDVSR